MSMTEIERYEKVMAAIKENNEIITSQRAEFENLVSRVIRALPEDHNEQHNKIRTHLAMSPEPKEHGEHHEFTQSLQKHFNSVIEVIVKSIGYVIVAALLLGAGAWVMNVTNGGSPKQSMSRQAE